MRLRQPPRVISIRNQDVVLDRAVAEAFGVQTRAVNQAVARNPAKFGAAHVFQLTPDEADSLRSQAVISKTGRGGSRALPRAFTMKSVARLATVIDTQEALQATDLIIDVFIAVWKQVAQGATAVAVPNPSRLLPSGPQAALVRLRKKLLAALDGLLDTVINRKTQTTVREEIEEATVSALAYLKERMKTRGLENDKLAAETLLVLEQVRDLRERRQEQLRRARAHTEGVILDNLDKKISLVERALEMLSRLEPNAIVSLYADIASTATKALPPPRHRVSAHAR
jgi:hypothetical protein